MVAKFGPLPPENDSLGVFEVAVWVQGAGERRNLNSRDLHSLTCGQNIIRVMTSRRAMRAGHLPCLVEGGGGNTQCCGRETLGKETTWKT